MSEPVVDTAELSAEEKRDYLEKEDKQRCQRARQLPG